jgi:hypothetical protein
MTLSVSSQVAPVGTKLVVQTDANSTPNNAVTSAAGKIYQIDVDNEANSDNAAYLKIYDNASPTVGTTPPDFVLKVPVNQRRNMVIPDGLDFTDLSFAVVTAGGTAGTTDPTNPVVVKLVTT